MAGLFEFKKFKNSIASLLLIFRKINLIKKGAIRVEDTQDKNFFRFTMISAASFRSTRSFILVSIILVTKPYSSSKHIELKDCKVKI
jgi:hypothetical protein